MARPSPAVRLDEGLEKTALRLRIDTDAAVRHGEAKGEGAGVLVERLHAHDDLAPFGELDRVAREIDEHLAQTTGVAAKQGRRAGRKIANELEALVEGPFGEERERVLHQHAQIELHRIEAQLSGLDA